MSNDTFVDDPSNRDRNYSRVRYLQEDVQSKSNTEASRSTQPAGLDACTLVTQEKKKEKEDNNGEKGDVDATAMFENAIVVTSASVSLIGLALIGCFLPHTAGHMVVLSNMEAR